MKLKTQFLYRLLKGDYSQTYVINQLVQLEINELLTEDMKKYILKKFNYSETAFNEIVHLKVKYGIVQSTVLITN